MHVTSKEVDNNGVHILTSVIEGDGAVELASDKAQLEAKVVSASRTLSGGVQIQVALTITEPSAPKVASAEEQALEYLKGKGLKEDEAKSALEKFGLGRIQAQQSEEQAQAQAKLDEELKQLVS